MIRWATQRSVVTWTSGRFRAAAIVLALVSLWTHAGSAGAPTIPFPVPSPVIPDQRFDIREEGAVEGGTTKCTDAIRRTIAKAARAGGGHVDIPAGRWLTGAIHLESHIDLHLAPGAELLFSQDPADYLPVVFSRHEETECFKYSAFIYADAKTDIAITGEGVLEGQGKPWWSWKTASTSSESLLVSMGNRNIPVAQRIFDGKHGRRLRPAFFQPMRCTNVLVEGVTFRYGAFWTITPTYCENVIVRTVKVVTDGDYGHTPNGDGVDPSSCKNVLIEGCEFSTGDDCIAIKAGRDVDGRRVGIPTENVVVRDCVGRQGHGGIVIGSETAAGIRRIIGYRCHFSGTDRMIRIKTQRGRGGVLEDMWFDEISGEDIKAEALHVNMLYTGSRLPVRPVDAATPVVRNLHFSNIRLRSGGGYAVEVLGIPEMPARNITFDSLTLSSAKGIHVVDARNIVITHSGIIAGQSPACRLSHVQGISLIDDRFDPPLDSDPTSVGDDVEGLRRDGPVPVDTLQPWSARIAQSFLLRHPGAVTFDSVFTQSTWNYEQGLMLLALERMYVRTRALPCYWFVVENLGRYLRNDGSIATYTRTEYNLDNIAPGSVLLDLAALGGEGRATYLRAADTLRQQLREQPRTDEGGFWHKKIYPYQMWLDGLFMAEPFYAKYAVMQHDTAAMADVVRQFRLVTRHTRDAATGLLYHGYDERRAQRWADPATGRSPSFWARAIGWYAMALVDVLDVLPATTEGRSDLLAMLRDVARAVASVQDSASGVWYQVIDQPRRPGNYPEASASAMFTYVFARGAAKGYLDHSYLVRAKRAFQGMIRQFVVTDRDGYVNFVHTCKGAGLGGSPYRDGSYAYYIHEPQRINDLKGLGPFLMAALELETLESTQ